MKRSQQIAGQMKEKRGAIETIFAKNRDEQGNLKSLPEEDQKQVKALQEELKTLNADFTSATELEQIELENKAALDKLSEPQYPAPLGPSQIEKNAAERGQKAGQALVEGSQPAGATYVRTEHDLKQSQLRQLSVAYEEGELGLDTKTLSTISSKTYRDAFRSYIRKGKEGLALADLKILQEGVDSQGGSRRTC